MTEKIDHRAEYRRWHAELYRLAKAGADHGPEGEFIQEALDYHWWNMVDDDERRAALEGLREIPLEPESTP